MTIEVIEKFIKDQSRKGTTVNIHFKERSTVSGMFIYGKDYSELKSKTSGALLARQTLINGKSKKI